MFHCCGKIFDKNDLKKEGFIQAHGFKSFDLLWQGGLGRVAFTSCHPGNRERERMPVLTGFSPLFHLGPSLEDGCTHIQGRSPTPPLVNGQWKPLADTTRGVVY
jgi:hypothetical protein